jgi:hypothetical protein
MALGVSPAILFRMAVAAANIAAFWGNPCMDPESIAGETPALPGFSTVGLSGLNYDAQ